MEQKTPQALSTPQSVASHRSARPRRSLVLHLVLWALGLSVSSAVLAVTLKHGLNAPGRSVSIALDGFLLAVYCGAFWYSCVRFRGSAEIRWMLTAAAFVVLLCTDSVEILKSVGCLDWVQMRTDGRFGVPSMLGAGLLLAVAGRTGRSARRFEPKRVAEYSVAGLTVLYVVRIVLGSHLDTAVGAVRRLADAADASSRGMVFSAFDIGVVVLIIAAYWAAASSHARRFLNQEDHVAKVLSYWCIAAGLSAVYLGSSQELYGPKWWIATFLSSCAGVVLLSGLNSENGRAYTEVQEKMGELEALHAVSWELVGTGTLGSLVNAFAWALHEHLRADMAAVFLHEPDENGLRLASTAGMLDSPQGVNRVHSLAPDRRPGFHSGHTSKAFQGCEVVVVEEIHADVEFLPWQVLAKHGGMVVSVPIVDSGETLGVYDLYFASLKRVPADKIRLCQTIAAAAGAAIRHVQLKEMADIQSDQAEVDDVHHAA